MNNVLITDYARRRKIIDTGSIVVGNTPGQFASQFKSEFEVYSELVKKRGFKINSWSRLRTQWGTAFAIPQPFGPTPLGTTAPMQRRRVK